MDYWAQRHSTIEEAGLCPNELASSTWLPVDADCMLHDQVDPSACAPETAFKLVRGEWKQGATVLICNTSHRSTWAFFGFADCDEERYYALAAAPQLLGTTTTTVWTIAPPGSDGFLRFTMVSWPKEGATLDTVRLEKTTDTTWNGIEKIFIPESVVGNDPDLCGFWFIPYQYFQEGNVWYKPSGHDTPEVSFMNIEWDDQSYLTKKSTANQNLDYSLLEQSTKTQASYDFEGPLDYEELEKQSKEIYKMRTAQVKERKRKFQEKQNKKNY
jgi:hypothetical protein